MIKFTTLTGETIRIRPGLILGALTAVANGQPLVGKSMLITQGGNLGPVTLDPDDVYEKVKDAERHQFEIELTRAQKIREMEKAVCA
jgi:hypothetical protein